MATLKSASESTSDVLVLGLSSKAGKLSIHPNLQHIAVVSHDLKKLLGILGDLGATGKVDEVIKVPFTGPKLVLFTGFGSRFESSHFAILSPSPPAFHFGIGYIYGISAL